MDRAHKIEPFEQSPAQAPISTTAPLIRAAQPVVAANWLLNQAPGPPNHGAYAVVRAKLGLSATALWQAGVLLGGADLIAWELDRD